MKKVFVLIGAIMIALTVLEIIDTYAKYTSEGYANAQKQAGAWVIKINDDNISARNSIRQFAINSLTYPSNQYVLENKIAPSSTGYFDIVIDATGTSVAIRYDVTIDLSEMDISDAINFESANVIGENNQLISLTRTGENTYTGIISLDDIQNEELTTTRFYISWDEDLTGANDEDDSRLGVLREETSLSLPVSVTISQYNGEQLVPYV